MYQIIKQLLEDIDEMNYRYQHVKINGGSFDFYKDVEPYVKNIDNHLEALNCYSKRHYRNTIYDPTKVRYFDIKYTKTFYRLSFP